jgi:hypothetical protein
MRKIYFICGIIGNELNSKWISDEADELNRKSSRTVILISIMVTTSIVSCTAPSLIPVKTTDIKKDNRLNLLIWDASAAMNAREGIRSGSPDFQPAAKQLQNDVKGLLAKGPYSVMNKKGLPPDGNRHNYMSLSIYYWPDPKSADGRPYILRDGEVNPESDTDIYDKASIGAMNSAVRNLSQAWCFLGDAACGERAALLLRTWFIDPATRMNSNMDYAQCVQGKNTGTQSGIIESVILLDVVDSAAFLEDCPSWTQADREGLMKWFHDYAVWLQTSKNGTGEAAATNNHGTWYDAQLSAYLLFAGDINSVSEIFTSNAPKHIFSQIEPDGSQPQELRRTRSLHYSLYNLMAYISLAMVGDHAGYDLWNYTTSDGRSIHRALDYVMPYLNGKNWPYQQIIKEDYAGFAPYLKMAAARYGDSTYGETANKLLGNRLATDRSNLLCPK